MKVAKSLLIILAMLILIPVSVAAGMSDDWDHFKQKAVTYNAPGDFGLDFWMEKFQGGFPGQPGNVLLAVGDGFVFQNAVLKSAVPHPTKPGYYLSTYVGGELLLNSGGPWLKKDKQLRASDITATNVSLSNATLTQLEYTLTFSGRFDNDPDLCFDVTAEYAGFPVIQAPPFGDPIWLFQAGGDSFGNPGFSATITLKRCGKAW